MEISVWTDNAFPKSQNLNTSHEKPCSELLIRVVQEILRTLQTITIALVATPEMESKCLYATHFKHRAGNDVKASFLRTSFHGTGKYHSSLHRREATRSDTYAPQQ